MNANPSVEIEVMGIIASGLQKLSEDPEARRRVLQWAASAFLPDGAPLNNPQSPPPTTAKPQPAEAAVRVFESLPDLYAAVSPTTDADRALIVGYWFQALKGEQDLDGFQINKELRHLGHGIGNITTALNSLIGRRPQLVIQTRKSGTSKQARKRYRLTDAGIRTAERMIASNES